VATLYNVTVMALDFDTYLFSSSPVELQLPARFFRRRWSRDLNDVDAPVDGLKSTDIPVETEQLECHKENSDVCSHGHGEDEDSFDSADGLGITKCQDRYAQLFCTLNEFIYILTSVFEYLHLTFCFFTSCISL